MLPSWKNKRNGKVKEASRWKQSGGAYFDKAKADRAVDFIETCCRHVKGELAGQPLLLEWWFKQIVRAIFGWLRPDGSRLFREVYIEVPRKNAKSTYGAALALTLLFTENEGGSEIYSAAADTDQAAIVFSIAKGMIEQDPVLNDVCEPFRRSIVYKDRGYYVLSADAPTKHGKNSAGILFDELHAQPNRELYDVLKTSTGARRQPLLIMFTTAGFDRNSICWEVHDYAQKVIDGSVNDPAFLPIIYAADPEDDWTSRKIWKKANPNFGVSIKEDYLRAECEKAKVTPAYENTFKRLHLNLWTEQETRWLKMETWDNGAVLPFDPESLRGRYCYGGLDLSDSNDLTALVLVFPPDQLPIKAEQKTDGDSIDRIDFAALDSDPFYVLAFFWIPEENLRERVRRDHVPYDTWLKQGLITATPGNSIDHRYIAMTLGKVRLDYDLQGIYFDPFGSRYLVPQLVDEYGFTLDEEEGRRYRRPWLLQAPQTYQFWTPPLNDLINFLLARKIAHGGNPVLRWNALNAVIEEGRFGGIRLVKKKSREKIDGLVALGMGMEAAIRNANRLAGSKYEERDLLIL
jgi:phage terminase large subunit-like protein